MNPGYLDETWDIILIFIHLIECLIYLVTNLRTDKMTNAAALSYKNEFKDFLCSALKEKGSNVFLNLKKITYLDHFCVNRVFT